MPKRANIPQPNQMEPVQQMEPAQQMAQPPQMQSISQQIDERRQKELMMLQQGAKLEEALEAAPKKIGPDQVRKASETLRKYKEGKAMLEKKIIQNEQFWKMRQWGRANHASENGYMPSTAWLWSCIQSRYSDVMDSYPTCNIQPRQIDDKAEAKKLSSIVPVILAQNNYEETYSDEAWYVLKHGGGIQSVLWDGTKHNGRGDIAIKKVDFLNFFWESGVQDIQDSANIFVTELVDNALLEQRYPECRGKLGGSKEAIAHYLYDDHVDVSNKSCVVDWYYKTEYNGRKALQYVKFVNDIVLYATENETKLPTRQEMDPTTGVPIMIPDGEPMSVRGLYDHAKYPFVVQSLFPVEGSICGYGLTDIGRDAQITIDQMSKAVADNTLANSVPRYFERLDGSINEQEFLDLTTPIVHVNGSLDEANVRAIDTKALGEIYVQVLNNKIEELKYTTSNQDSNNGVAPSGITAASAIAALQETAGKNARSANMSFHRAYREVIYFVIELIRQFYDIPRWFRIVPDAMGEEFVQFDNSGLVEQPMMNQGMNMGMRLPEFDIEVTTEKSSPYKKMERNELALNFYNAGFFNPANSDQAIACLDMMDFEKKDEIIAGIRKNGTMQELLLQYQQLCLELASRVDPALAQQLGSQILQQAEMLNGDAAGYAYSNISKTNGENPIVARARTEARGSTQVE